MPNGKYDIDYEPCKPISNYQSSGSNDVKLFLLIQSCYQCKEVYRVQSFNSVASNNNIIQFLVIFSINNSCYLLPNSQKYGFDKNKDIDRNISNSF